jgi:DHA1 family bicyclomycin/chloramphenicol resistance-like MFS transporter
VLAALKLDTRTTAFTVLLGILAGLTSLSLDPFIPSMPTLVKEFGVPVTTVQLTITVFFIGLACGQVIYGPFSDHYGRRPPLIVGLTLFLVATVYCANAGSIEGLIAGRFFQALGASSGTVLGRSIVRDLYSWNEAAQKMAVVWLVFGVMPLFGPLVGAALLVAWGWQSIFWFMAALTALIFAAILFGLPETAILQHGAAPTPIAVARDYAFLLRQRHFLIYVAVIFVIQTGIFAFVANSSFVLITALGFSAGQFGLIFAGIVTGHLCGAAVGSRLVRKIGIDSTIRCGVFIAFVSGVTMVVVAWLRIDLALAIIVPMFFFMSSGSLVTPHAMAAAMSPFPKFAGAASSLIGVAQLGGGAAASYLLGFLFDGTARPVATAIALCGLAAAVLYECFIGSSQRRRVRAAQS